MGQRPDLIEVRGLEVDACVGVPEEERASPQRLLIDLELEPAWGFGDLADDLAGTVDYYEVTRGVIALAAGRPRKLIETLAEDIAGWLLGNYPVERVGVGVRKFILDDAEHVAVRVERRRS